MRPTPFASRTLPRRKSLSTRVMVSRVEPIIWAISSCVYGTRMWIPSAIGLPVDAHQSRSSRANFSAVLCARPSERISRCAS